MYQKNQENMQSSLVSKNFPGPTNSSGDMIEHLFKMLVSQLENMQLESNNGLEIEKSTNYSINVTEPWVYFSCHALSWEAFLPLSKKWMHRSINDNTC